MTKVKKAVIPVAGLGTRFLPATKAMPKEMLPIVNKPTIQFIVEEALASGIEDILFVTGKNKRAVEDHFDSNLGLEKYLEDHEQEDLAKRVKDTTGINLYFVRQSYPKGLGDAVLHAKAFVGNDPFVVMLGDDLMADTVPLTKQLINVYDETHASVIAVVEVPKDETDKYGVIAPEGKYAENVYNVKQFVEKPDPADAPSNLAIVGRYLLTAEIFDCLEHTEIGKGNEIQLTDAIDRLNKTQRVFALNFKGDRYDVGAKIGFLETTITYGLTLPEYKDDLKDFIVKVADKLD